MKDIRRKNSASTRPKKSPGPFFKLLIGLGLGLAGANALAMPNPWVECRNSFTCGAKASGVEFIKMNYTVRAMPGMIEVRYPVDKKRWLMLRKSDPKNKSDISGDYNLYPIDQIWPINGIETRIRAKGELIYVVNFLTKEGNYSMSCEDGLTREELMKFIRILADLEEIKQDLEQK